MLCIVCKQNRAMHDLVICLDCLKNVKNVSSVRKYITMRKIYDALSDNKFTETTDIVKFSTVTHDRTLRVLREMEEIGLVESKRVLGKGNRWCLAWRRVRW